MKSFAATLLLTASFLAPVLAGCAHQGDSIVVTGEGKRLSSEAIDKDPFALLPSQPVALLAMDGKAFFDSPFGAQLAQLASQNFPIGQEAGFLPERDVRKVVAGFYSMAGLDAVAVVSGDFHPESIARAAEIHATTPLGTPLVRSRYAGNDVYTSGNVGLTLLTPHTMLVGTETAMRRAMDRIRDNRLDRSLPGWMTSLLEGSEAPMVAAGDLADQAPIATVSQQLPFLAGVQNFRLLGNFQPPGVNLAGALTYPDAASASNGARTVQSLGQMAGFMNLFSVFGFGSPVQKLESQVVENDVQVVMAMDAQSVTRLLGQANAWRPR